jgi:hypothetical protein
MKPVHTEEKGKITGRRARGLLVAPEIRWTLGFSTASAAIHRRELRCSMANAEAVWGSGESGEW